MLDVGTELELSAKCSIGKLGEKPLLLNPLPFLALKDMKTPQMGHI